MSSSSSLSCLNAPAPIYLKEPLHNRSANPLLDRLAQNNRCRAALAVLEARSERIDQQVQQLRGRLSRWQDRIVQRSQVKEELLSEILQIVICILARWLHNPLFQSVQLLTQAQELEYERQQLQVQLEQLTQGSLPTQELDRSTILEALAEDIEALAWLGLEWYRDPMVASIAFAGLGWGEAPSQDAPVSQQQLEELGRLLLEHRWAWQLAHPEFLKDSRCMAGVIKPNPQAWQRADLSLQSSKPFQEKVLESHGLLLAKMPEEIRNDEQLVLIAVRQDGLALEAASPELKKQELVVAAALSSTLSAVQFAEPNCGAKLLLKALGAPTLESKDDKELSEGSAIEIAFEQLKSYLEPGSSASEGFQEAAAEALIRLIECFAQQLSPASIPEWLLEKQRLWSRVIEKEPRAFDLLDRSTREDPHLIMAALRSLEQKIRSNDCSTKRMQEFVERFRWGREQIAEDNGDTKEGEQKSREGLDRLKGLLEELAPLYQKLKADGLAT